MLFRRRRNFSAAFPQLHLTHTCVKWSFGEGATFPRLFHSFPQSHRKSPKFIESHWKSVKVTESQWKSPKATPTPSSNPLLPIIPYGTSAKEYPLFIFFSLSTYVFLWYLMVPRQKDALYLSSSLLTFVILMIPYGTAAKGYLLFIFFSFYICFSYGTLWYLMVPYIY